MAETQADSLQAWLRWAEHTFEEQGLYYGHGTDNATDEALYLIHFVLRDEFDYFCDHADQTLSPAQNQAIQRLFDLRINSRKPAAYLVKEAWFAGYAFYVDERVLVPRSPLAELIELEFVPWIDIDKVETILDIGTGSGCIGIACALYYSHVKVDEIDLERDALDVAKINVERYHLEDRVSLYQGDIYQGLPDKKYDIILSNPPYVTTQEMTELPQEYRHEPASGLVAGADGLDCVRKILHGAADRLTPNGILVVEVGNTQTAVEQAWPDVPFVWLEFEYGGDGVFMLEAGQVLAYRERFEIEAT